MKKFILAIFLLLTSTLSFAGAASWYGPKFHGKLTASGEKFNMHALTAAHRTLTFGSKVKVTNKRNGKSTVVCINDRGPYSKGRIIDLSKAAARKLGIKGVGKVTLEVIHQPKSWRYGKKVCK